VRSFDAPIPASLDIWGLVIALGAAIAIFRFKAGMIRTLAASCAVGVVLHACIPLSHQLLNCDCAFDGCDDGRKFQEHAVAHGLDDAPAKADHKRLRGFAMLADSARRTVFVFAHKSGIPDDIDGKDRSQATSRGHRCETPPLGFSKTFPTFLRSWM
jgi:hypothetical protein